MTYSPLDFTVGIELEFLLALKEPSTPEPASGDADSNTASWSSLKPTLNPLEYLKDRFASAGLPSVTVNEPKASDINYKTWLITRDGSISEEVPQVELDHNLASILKRPASQLEQEKWSTHAIELVSPPVHTPSVSSAVPAYRQSALASISAYLDILRRSSSTLARESEIEHAAFPTQHCGFHIHIGLPNPRCIPLPILQHLAVLLLKFEAVLSSLHHHSRSPLPGTQAARYAKSNRTSFIGSRHSSTCALGSSLKSSNRKDGGNCSFDLERGKQRIFAKGMTIQKLSWLMGSDDVLDDEGHIIEDEFRSNQHTSSLTSAKNPPSHDSGYISANEIRAGDDLNADYHSAPEGNKYKLSRWNLLPRHISEGPRTIEFRQAAGTLDAEEIGETIRLYTALLRAAERLADDDGRRGKDGQSEETIHCYNEGEPSLNDLVDLLQLPPSAKRYWEKVAVARAEERFFASRDDESLKKWEQCHECAVAHDRRNTLRRMAAEDARGWRAHVNVASSGKPNRPVKRKPMLQVKKVGPWGDTFELMVGRLTRRQDDGEKRKPMKNSKRKKKGKKPQFTRKEKRNAKTRARVKARRERKKALAKGAAGWDSVVVEATQTWAGDVCVPAPVVMQRWESASAGAPDVPEYGW